MGDLEIFYGESSGEGKDMGIQGKHFIGLFK